MRTLLKGAFVWSAGEGAPYRADVLVDGQRIREIFRGGAGSVGDAVTIDLTGCTLIPGLVDGHSHLSFAEPANFAEHGNIPPEEHVLITMRNARKVLEAGFTSVLSAGAAKPRLDVVIRNAINTGQIPGPRMLAASPELTNTGNLGDERLMHIYRESVGTLDRRRRTGDAQGLPAADPRGGGHDQAQRLRQPYREGGTAGPDHHGLRSGAGWMAARTAHTPTASARVVHTRAAGSASCWR